MESLLPDITLRTSLLFIALICATTFLVWLSSRRQTTLPLPPGPKGLPLIGNLHQAPTEFAWRQYQQWTKEFGPIFKLNYCGQLVIVLGTAKSASDLLDKRSSIYSDRPRSVMAFQLMSHRKTLLFKKNDDNFRMHKRIVTSYTRSDMSSRYRPVQDLESKQLMYELLSNKDFTSRFARYSASIITSLAYGKRMHSSREPQLLQLRQVTDRTIAPYFIDIFPVLLWLPRFLSPWKRAGEMWHEEQKGLFSDLFDHGVASDGWNWSKQSVDVSEPMENLPPDEHLWTIGNIMEAGLDTTTAALEVFVMAAILYPEPIAKARRDLDKVCGTSMPTFEHMNDLPYIEAIVNEVLRWRPVTAGGVPHALSRDDEYMGYRIPAGSMVIGSHWSIHMDEDVFSHPETFNPDRWIANPDLPQHWFGFGRRLCNGQHIARASLRINIARLIWAFEIEHEEDREGRRVEVDPMAFGTGFNSAPDPFGARFTVRGEEREEVVVREFRAAEGEFEHVLKSITPLSSA